MSSHQILKLHALDVSWVDAAIALDHKALGGLWTRQGYQQELERSGSICLGISTTTLQLIAMGFAWVIVDELHLISLAVDPAFQRQGLGTVLLAQLLLRARRQSCERATLEVRVSNRGAMGLYQQIGFKSLGTRPDYYGKGEAAEIFWLNQLQHQDTARFLNHCLTTCQRQLLARNVEVLVSLVS